MNERIQYAKENYEIDWDNAKIFIFPYKTIYFFISDSFEVTLGGGRSDLRNPDNWFTIPFDENINYKALREQCREFASQHPLEGDSPMVVELNMDDVMKKVAERMGERNEDQAQPESKPEPLQQPTPSAKNSGCMLLIGFILIPSLLLWLI